MLARYTDNQEPLRQRELCDDRHAAWLKANPAQRPPADTRGLRAPDARTTAIPNAGRRMRVMPRPRQITSINFADTFAHSLVSVAGMVKNVAHILVEAFVTQRLTSHR
jgi:hypothetical protein